MRNLLAFLAAAVVAFLVVGWWLDWYNFRSVPSPDGKPSVTVDFNTQKIREDVAKAQAAVEKQLAESKARQEAKRQAALAKKGEQKAEEKPADEVKPVDEKADAEVNDEEETEEAPPPVPERRRDR
jgi:hypothetical protein